MIKYIKIILSILVMVLLCGVSLALSEQPPPRTSEPGRPEQQHAPQAQEPRNNVETIAKQPPVLINKTEPIICQNNLSDNTNAGNNNPPSDGWNWSAIVSAIATVIIACFTINLAWSTKKLWEEAVSSSEIAKKTSQAAEKAAIAAEQSIKASREEFVARERPWVIVHKIISSSPLDLNSGLTFTCVVKNVGNSPGMNVDVSAVMHLPHRGDAHQAHRHLRESAANERDKRSAIENISFGHLLVPGEEMKITVRAMNDPIEYQKAAAVSPFGEIIILILGQVCYRFGVDESWHESGFIFSVRKRGGAWPTLSDGAIPIDDVEIERFSAGFYAT